MTERPILFRGSMVRAILDGRKSQTRRLLKPQPNIARNASPWYRPFPVARPCEWHCCRGEYTHNIQIVPYATGDRLWVREAWRIEGCGSRVPAEACRPYRECGRAIEYRADGYEPVSWRERSPIHMPRWASRITLEVTDVRVERLQEISVEDAREEGLEWVAPTWGVAGIAESWQGNPFAAFFALWDHINGPGAAAANPWVAAVSFRRVEA